MQDVTFSLIQEAARVLNGVARVTPVASDHTLDDISLAKVFLKCENLQRGGAFKFRGAYHAVSYWVATSSHRTFATVSSGNHAQGLALACRLLGCEAHIVMPAGSSPLKRQAVQSYGATVYDAADRDQANQLLDQLAQLLPAVIVHPFNDPFVIAGQGTIMLELLDQVDNLEVVLAPIGGGGLLSGLCLAAETLHPKLEVYACEPAGALDARESVRQNRIVRMPNPDTIADGLRASLGDRTLPILHRDLAGFFVVQEQEIIEAIRFAQERLDLVIEPSSAVALVPLLRKETQLMGKRVAVVLTGGNVDLPAFWKNVCKEI